MAPCLDLKSERENSSEKCVFVEGLRPRVGGMGAEEATSGGGRVGGGGGGFRARLDHYMYSGNPRHVFAGIAIVSAVFAVPWYFMTRGAKHQSHQDYLEKAEKANKARSDRLSSSQPSLK